MCVIFAVKYRFPYTVNKDSWHEPFQHILTCVCHEVEFPPVVMFKPILLGCLKHFFCTLWSAEVCFLFCFNLGKPQICNRTS